MFCFWHGALVTPGPLLTLPPLWLPICGCNSIFSCHYNWAIEQECQGKKQHRCCIDDNTQGGGNSSPPIIRKSNATLCHFERQIFEQVWCPIQYLSETPQTYIFRFIYLKPRTFSWPSSFFLFTTKTVKSKRVCLSWVWAVWATSLALNDIRRSKMQTEKVWTEEKNPALPHPGNCHLKNHTTMAQAAAAPPSPKHAAGWMVHLVDCGRNFSWSFFQKIRKIPVGVLHSGSLNWLCSWFLVD